MRFATTAAVLFLIAKIACALPWVADAAAESPPFRDAQSKQSEPLKPKPVFSDDFATDTRADYRTEGEVLWAAGQLTLCDGASLFREVNGGAWARLELRWDLPELTPEQPESELRVWFIRDGTTPCYVRIRRELKDGQVAGSLALIRTSEKDGEPVESQIRRVDAGVEELAEATLEYRYGLVSVQSRGELLLSAIADDGGRVAAAHVESAGAAVVLSQLGVAITPRESLSEQEGQQLLTSFAQLREANGLYAQGKYAEAEEAVRRALDIQGSVLGEQHLQYANTLRRLAVLNGIRGEYARAVPNYKRANSITKSVLGQRHPVYADSLHRLATHYQAMGDYAQAEPLFKQALDIRKSALGEQHPSYWGSLGSLGRLYIDLGDHTRAERLYKQALELEMSVRGEQRSSSGDILNGLAWLYAARGDYTRAEPLYRRALALAESKFGAQHVEYAAALTFLVNLYGRMGDYPQAIRLAKQSRNIMKMRLGEQHPSYAHSQIVLSHLYARMGDYALAEPLSVEADTIIRTFLNRSAPAESERQQKRHQSENRKYLDWRLSITRASDAKAVEHLESLWRWKGAVTLRQRAYRRLTGNPQLASMFETLQSVSRQLSVVSTRAPTAPAASAGEDVQARYTRDRSVWEQQFSTLTRQREELEGRIAAENAEFRETRELLTVAAVRKLLPPGTAFVDFLEYTHVSLDANRQWHFERRYIAFVVTRERAPVQIGMSSVEPIEAAITAFRRPLTGDRRSSAAAEQAAARLRQELWLPLEEHLDGIETVIISPDTALGMLPFAALPGASPGSYLLEQYRFVSLPMAMMLRSLPDDESHPSPAKGLLAVGDVAYGGEPGNTVPSESNSARPAWMRGPTRSGKWDALPSAGVELADVERTFRKKFGSTAVTSLDGARATEEAFMTQAPQHYNLHVVTHGFFAGPEVEAFGTSSGEPGINPFSQSRRAQKISGYMPGLLSGLVLAGANEPPLENNKADGILTASEIETLDLNAVDLVVLSACDTGLGKTAGGEGLTGLQRAFHIAGARSVVASLWAVDDKATQELMSRFYRYYWNEGRSKIDSLRQAQLDLLNDQSLTRGAPLNRQQVAVDADGKPPQQRAHPRYWAAFVLSGDWR